jgi:hypothetical protein
MKLALFIAIFSTMLIITPVSSINVRNVNDKKNLENMKSNESPRGTEYWALLVGVGEYYNHPEQNRPKMLEAVDTFNNVLLKSSNWQSDHIHTLKSSQATLFNFIKEFIWLIINADKDDMVLIFITTHGAPLKFEGQPLDLPPKDEADGADEILVMYYGFEKGYSIITDDMLNFFLGLLRAKGVCVIIDSCYSGGFNDQPWFMTQTYNLELSPQNYNAELFKQDFIEEIASQNRIILMSTTEFLLSYNCIFAEAIIAGLSYDLADTDYGNGDGINSAEEAFILADQWVNIEMGGAQDPTILDLYPGEFPLTFAKD